MRCCAGGMQAVLLLKYGLLEKVDEGNWQPIRRKGFLLISGHTAAMLRDYSCVALLGCHAFTSPPTLPPRFSPAENFLLWS